MPSPIQKVKIEIHNEMKTLPGKQKRQGLFFDPREHGMLSQEMLVESLDLLGYIPKRSIPNNTRYVPSLLVTWSSL